MLREELLTLYCAVTSRIKILTEFDLEHRCGVENCECCGCFLTLYSYSGLSVFNASFALSLVLTPKGPDLLPPGSPVSIEQTYEYLNISCLT